MHPVILKVVDISKQILLTSLVLALSLYVCLQIVCSTKVAVDMQGMAESCSELRGELGQAIRNNALRYSCALYYKLPGP